MKSTNNIIILGQNWFEVYISEIIGWPKINLNSQMLIHNLDLYILYGIIIKLEYSKIKI